MQLQTFPQKTYLNGRIAIAKMAKCEVSSSSIFIQTPSQLRKFHSYGRHCGDDPFGWHQIFSRRFMPMGILLLLFDYKIHSFMNLYTASAKVDLKTKKLPRCRPCPHENLGNFQCNMWFWKNFSGKNQGFWFFENSDKVLLKLIQKLYIEIFHIQDGAFFKTDETVYLWM